VRTLCALGTLAIVLSAPACGDESAASRDAAQRGSRAAGVTPELLLRDADARQLTRDLRESAVAADPVLRRTATLALARLHDPATLQLLISALRDVDAVVRRHASLGLGALGEDAAGDERRARTIERALLGALAAESDAENRAAILEDLARAGATACVPALRAGLGSEDPEIRAAACRGWGTLGLRERPTSPADVRLIAARMVDDSETAVRLGCAYALTRTRPATAGDVRAAVIADLVRSAGDPDTEVRAMALRALGRYEGAPIDALEARTRDGDWRAATQAFRSLSKVGARADAALGRALGREVDAAIASRTETPRLHTLLAAFDAAAPLAQGVAVHAAAERAFDRLGTARLSDGTARAHCAAAKLVDLGRRWPSRLDRCGRGQVPADTRQIAMAEVIASVEGATSQRAVYLTRLYQGGNARVKEAALVAAGSVHDAAALRLVIRGLRSRDAGVTTSAADALKELAGLVRGQPTETPPDGGAEPAVDQPIPRDVREALTAALRFLQRSDELEGIQSWLGAVAALRARALRSSVRPLAAHSNPTVRAKVRETLTALGAELAAPTNPAPVTNVVAVSAFRASPSRPRVRLRTTRGTIEIALYPDEAPATVARFLELVGRRFFDGLAFHRVVPAFVIQTGDPRGDGYGGPGWSQRCEDNRLQYARGTVGMALAGRDTGGSQFFITHNAQPHLDFRYTAFGRVIAGMDVVDRIQQGDLIRDARRVDRPTE